MKKNKKPNKTRNLVWTLFGILIMSGIVWATTTITDTGITTPEVNSILYVESGNGDDIQTKINSCSINGCTVVIPMGQYSISNQIDLISNLTLENYGTLFWEDDASPERHEDNLGSNFSFMFFLNNSENLNFYNYGLIQPNKIFNNATNSEIIFAMFNTNNSLIYGGNIQDASVGYGIYNSNRIQINSVNFLDTSLSAVWTEFTNYVVISDIVGRGNGEAVDVNVGDRNMVINNIVMDCISRATDEILDINSGVNILFNNIIGFNCNRGFKSGDAVAQRFGIGAIPTANNITGIGVRCIECSLEPLIESEETQVLYYDNGIIKYSSLDSAVLKIENKGNFDPKIILSSDGDEDWQIYSNADAGDQLIIKNLDDTSLDRFSISQTGLVTIFSNLTIGSGTVQTNMTLTSPDGSESCCGVDNSDTFVCSAGAC